MSDNQQQRNQAFADRSAAKGHAECALSTRFVLRLLRKGIVMPRKQNIYGEGNYDATRKYNAATKKFVESGRVPQAARDATPKTPQEAAEMKRAEKAALLRAKDKKPAVKEPEPPDAAVDEPEQDPQEPMQKETGAPPSRHPDRR